MEAPARKALNAASEQIRTPNVGAEIAAQLRELIFLGFLGPGQRLRLRELAERLGVSTTPVREALLVLAKEGLVESRQHRGFQVRSLTFEDIRDTFQLHAFIAGILAERAATRMSSDNLVELRDLDAAVRAAVADGRIDDIEQQNYRFHRAINHSAQSHVLRRFLAETTRYVPRRFYLEIPGWLDATAHDHRLILRSLDKRDSVGARRAMETHINDAGELLIIHLSKTGRWNFEEPPALRKPSAASSSS